MLCYFIGNKSRERKNERRHHQAVSLICHIDKNMITYHGVKINNKLMKIDSRAKLQAYYNELVSNINRFSLSCAGDCQGNFIIHGYYNRRVKLPFGFFNLRIMRLRCKDCGRTHAILLSCLVPYSSIPLAVQVEISIHKNNQKLLKAILDRNPYMSECEIYNVVSRYINVWQQRLMSLRIESNDINQLVESCFSNYLMQFMQCRNTINILYTINHIG